MYKIPENSICKTEKIQFLSSIAEWQEKESIKREAREKTAKTLSINAHMWGSVTDYILKDLSHRAVLYTVPDCVPWVFA